MVTRGTENSTHRGGDRKMGVKGTKVGGGNGGVFSENKSGFTNPK